MTVKARPPVKLISEFKRQHMRYAIALAVLLLSNSLYGEIIVHSDVTQSNLIELYTSEGCSSCPPADRWLSTLTDHPALWHQLVPIAFHVDYWDYIGWKDRFARAEFTDRQRRYANENTLPIIYTPGLISNGKEWRNFDWKAPTTSGARNVGPMIVKVDADELAISFLPVQTLAVDKLVVNIALLGFGLTSDVRAGENTGRIQTHDFVVLGYAQAKMNFHDGSYQAATPRPRSNINAGRYATALWISTENEQTPLQAVGAWLDH